MGESRDEPHDKASTDPANAPAAPIAPVAIVEALCLLLICQLAGEALVTAVRAVIPSMTFPGPVIGMGLMFAILLVRGRVDAGLGAVGGGILGNLSLLFVPAAVGVVQYGGVIADAGLALVTALLVSTVATLVVTVLTFVFIARRFGGGSEGAERDAA
jgi:holin-like protein